MRRDRTTFIRRSSRRAARLDHAARQRRRLRAGPRPPAAGDPRPGADARRDDEATRSSSPRSGARRISRTCRSRSPRSAPRRSTSSRSTSSTIMPGSSRASPSSRSARASANVYFRGVASGENANHSASLPSVGTYLDEQPITTITGALDIHIFDIARVEALAGPQGTLYGASSQAGTIRIITNKPDTQRLLRRGQCRAEQRRPRRLRLYAARRFINAPLVEQRRAARRSAGTATTPAISTISRARLTFPTSGITFDQRRPSSRRIITTSTPMAPAPR